jgi:uncharacterized iron-regulated protein
MFMLLAKKEVLQWIAKAKKPSTYAKATPQQRTHRTFCFRRKPNHRNRDQKRNLATHRNITEANYKLVIPTAQSLQDAYDYLHAIYRGYDGYTRLIT